MLSIQTNVNSMNAQENLRMTNDFQARTIARLTSGLRINQSGDDAAGLAVANKYRSDIAELTQGVRNANDGLSTMQVIDGGLSNISKMLDRLKTLATQSASSSFEGNRATLNQEYSSLLTEIDRQASNIGLGNANGTASKYNKMLSVYIGGGGGTSSNSGVQVDLSASSDKVSASSLGIAGTSINGGWVIDAGATKTGLNSATILASNATQQFTVTVNGATTTATVRGGANGISGNDAVAQLNSQIASSGVSATIDSTTGKLQFISDKAFSIQAADASAAGTGLTTAAGNTTNTAMYASNGQTTYTAVAAGKTEKFDVALANGQKVSVTLDDTTGDTQAHALASLNTQLNSIGVYATTNAAGTGISLMSDSTFTVSGHANTGAAGEGMFGASSTATVAPTTTSAKDTTAATAAISSIASAVSALGVVQGKIGTAQNKLSYSIQLAQSQITNFSAAESRIRDADIAQEAANLTKAQVLSQASMAALAQANSAPQSVLSLLRG